MTRTEAEAFLTMAGQRRDEDAGKTGRHNDHRAEFAAGVIDDGRPAGRGQHPVAQHEAVA